MRKFKVTPTDEIYEYTIIRFYNKTITGLTLEQIADKIAEKMFLKHAFFQEDKDFKKSDLLTGRFWRDYKNNDHKNTRFYTIEEII